MYARLVGLCVQIRHNTRDWHLWKWSPKLSFIIVSNSRNVNWWSPLSSALIVLTDLSITTFGWPVHDSSCTSCGPCGTLSTISSPSVRLWCNYHIHQSAVCELQPHSYFLPLKTVSQHGVRTWWVAPCLLYYSPHSFRRSHPQKIQRCHNPKQNISPNFHSIWTVRWWGEKMGNLRLG